MRISHVIRKYAAGRQIKLILPQSVNFITKFPFSFSCNSNAVALNLRSGNCRRWFGKNSEEVVAITNEMQLSKGVYYSTVH